MFIYSLSFNLNLVLKFKLYLIIVGYSGFDLDNIGKGKGGGACTAAAFLKVHIFVEQDIVFYCIVHEFKLSNKIFQLVFRNLLLQVIGFTWILLV